jgi:hypothetical protein
MNATISVAVAAVSVFVASSIWYGALSPLEARAVGSAAVDRGRPSPRKALLELLRGVLVGTVVAGVARAAHLHGVGATVLFSDAGRSRAA